jgi:hypothetical protein
MDDEFKARQRAINLRLAGRTVAYICAAVGRVKAWCGPTTHRGLFPDNAS